MRRPERQNGSVFAPPVLLGRPPPPAYHGYRHDAPKPSRPSGDKKKAGSTACGASNKQLGAKKEGKKEALLRFSAQRRCRRIVAGSQNVVETFVDEIGDALAFFVRNVA